MESLLVRPNHKTHSLLSHMLCLSMKPVTGRRMNAAAVSARANSSLLDTVRRTGFYGSIGECQRLQEVHTLIQ